MDETENVTPDQDQFNAEDRKSLHLRQLRDIIDQQDSQTLSALYDDVEPIDFALLVEDLDDEELRKLRRKQEASLYLVKRGRDGKD